MRKVLLIVAGLIVFGAHIAWHVLFPEANASGWGNVTPLFSDSLRTYFTSGAPWLGASYAMSAAFTAYALLIFRENRRKAAAGAVGGLVAMGALYAVGCFALGCCGSPMLPIYLSLLGGKLAGAGGPVMFGLTLLSVGIGFLILRRNARCVCEGPCTEDVGGQG
ncbi:MAG: hypothetical protein ACXW4S_10750 [Candidatus Deferrimicrobiaceae bacterium]